MSQHQSSRPAALQKNLMENVDNSGLCLQSYILVTYTRTNVSDVRIQVSPDNFQYDIFTRNHMENVEWRNQTTIREFILLGFGDLQGLQTPLFLLFLVIYVVTMAGNILIVALVVTDRQLHTPMYFFLGNLSCLETCYTSTILPRMLASFLTGDRTISFSGCITQLSFFVFMVTAECLLLLLMSYDRYLAICNPLHYAALMSRRVCIQILSGSWIIAFSCSTVITFMMVRLTFCGPNRIDHFFCDFTPMLKLSCSDTSLIALVDLILSFAIILPTLLLTLTSYVCIIATILRISSTTGRQKAFSTCSSHLIVVATFYGSLIIIYMAPKAGTAGDLRKLFSVFYTVLTPLANPLIYSLRNKEVKEALKKAGGKLAALIRK
ncbi:olfactory receptor 6B1-like [Chrysemys picta bellii]|uniref:olfactory receptor 6B1-like n=1 Tax=Chrysemys picta bellii TaxID=8478 RepID=UPI00046BFA8B|nr:olfactory receptor 6B1-like [Chrysemys picta bellii]